MVPRSSTAPPPTRWLGAFLNLVERIGNRLPEPLILFVILAAAIPLASALTAWSGWTLTHPTTGAPLRPVNLLEPPQLQRMLTSAVPNFVGFPPLGVVLVAMLGVGMAEKSGLLAAGLRLLVSALPRPIVTVGVVLAGLLSNVASDAGYVVLVPLAGVVFASVGRHPLAGICAAFAGVSAGFSANLLISTLDPMLAGFTQSAAQLLDPDYQVTAVANYYFMAASTLLLAVLGALVTERIVEPRLGRYAPSDGTEVPSPSAPGITLTPTERRAVFGALASVAAGLGGILLLTLPSKALLRSPGGGLEPFFQALVPLMAILFFVPGLVYGVWTGSVRSGRTLARMLGDTLGTMGSYIVLAFVASQFIAYFAWSNLGLMLAVSGADVLKASGLSTSLLLVGTILVVAGINLFIGSASAKWALLSPVLVPLMMELQLSPEMAQAAYRVGDSVTNIITPLMPYFPIVVAFGQKWVPDLKLGTFLASMLPYSLTFFVGWVAFLLAWFWLDLPLGPNAPSQYLP